MAAPESIGCVLDTSAVILHLRKYPGVEELLLEMNETRGRLAVSAVTLVEIWQGTKKGEEEKTRRFFEGTMVIPLNKKLAERAGHLAQSLRKKGLTIEMADIVIAATALEAKAPVLTTNQRHFSYVGGLEILEIGVLAGGR
ncbi:MAG: type II toxin-antitoxin system VapC family toxin [Thermoanaerobacteraceae bacterium]|nr:type II toxin-antitoxin system VapC family toxin [Thermoanaerobacteraceae bacterium]